MNRINVIRSTKLQEHTILLSQHHHSIHETTTKKYATATTSSSTKTTFLFNMEKIRVCFASLFFRCFLVFLYNTIIFSSWWSWSLGFRFTQSYNNKKLTYYKSVSWLLFLAFKSLICLVETRKVSGPTNLLLVRLVGVPMSKEYSEKSMHEMFGIALQLWSLLFNKHLQQLSKKILLVHCVIFNCIRIRRQDISKTFYICFEENDDNEDAEDDQWLSCERRATGRCFFFSIFDAMIPKIRGRITVVK